MTNAQLAALVEELKQRLDASNPDALKEQLDALAETNRALEERIAVLEQEKLAAYDDAAIIARIETLENVKLPAGAINLFTASGDTFMKEWISTVLHKYHANDMPEQLPVTDPVDGN